MAASAGAQSLPLRDHLDDMRALWRRLRDTGDIPDAVPTEGGRYRID